MKQSQAASKYQLCVFFILMFALACSDSKIFKGEKFDGNVWKTSLVRRHKMLHSLENSKLLIGLDRGEIEQLLGEADEMAYGAYGTAKGDQCLYYKLDLNQFPNALESANFVIVIRNGKAVSTTKAIQ